MKKSLIIFLAVVLTVSMTTSAFALGSGFEDGNYETTVTADFSDSYTISIPTEINLRSKDTGVSGVVTIRDLVLADGFTLMVTVFSEEGWNLVSSDGSKLAYTAEVDGKELSVTYADVLGVTNRTEADGLTATIVFTLTDDPMSGVFTDKLTFYAFVVPPNGRIS